MSDPTYKATTSVTLDQVKGGYFAKKADAEQAALIRAFKKLPDAIQTALIGDAQSESIRSRNEPTITGAQVMAQGGDRSADAGETEEPKDVATGLESDLDNELA